MRLRLYEELTNREPRPFDWKFDRATLQAFLAKLEAKRSRPAPSLAPVPLRKRSWRNWKPRGRSCPQPWPADRSDRSRRI